MAIDLTSYNLSQATSVRRVSGAIQDTAEDGTLRTLNFADATLYDVSCVVEGLTATARDTLIDLIDGAGSEEITVSTGTRDYSGPLVESTPAQWSANSGRFSVTWLLRGSVV